MPQYVPKVRQSLALTLISAMMLMLSGPAPIFAQGPEVVDPRWDVTGNLVVSVADVSDVRDSWNIIYESDRCMIDSALESDTNGDGCLDVSDVQRFASIIGGVTTLKAPILNVGVQAVLAEATFTVNSSKSGSPTSNPYKDTNPGDGQCKTSEGTCTIQAALQEANVRPGREKINFDIKADDGISCPAVVNIRPNYKNGRWLQIDDPTGGGVTIDGYTQCGASKNTGAVVGNAMIKIELNGTVGTASAADPGVNGIEIKTPNNIIRGLSLYNWDRQIELSNVGVLYNKLEGNFIGTNAAGTFAQANGSPHHREGVRLQYGTSYNIIGCGSFEGTVFKPCTNTSDIRAARNIVAGNGDDGIHLESGGTSSEGDQVTNNHIVGNYIGVLQDGQSVPTLLVSGAPRAQYQADGVDLENGVQYNWLGGETAGERNVISGNDSQGTEVSHSTLTQYNKIVNNYYGLSADGTKAVPNTDDGISFEDTVNKNELYNNTLSGNNGAGVRFYIEASENNIHNNWIGVAGDHTTAMPNAGDGIFAMGGSQHNLIKQNLIAYNKEAGIDLSNQSDQDHGGFGETFYNTISQNQMYSNVGKGIELSVDNGVTANQGQPAPALKAAGTTLVYATTCPGCTVEVFIADNSNANVQSEGQTFVGSAVADQFGNAAVPVSNVKTGQALTATTTDTLGNTSEFALNLIVGSANVPATATSVAQTAQTKATATAAAEQTATTIAAALTATAITGQTQTAISIQQTATTSAQQTADTLATQAAATSHAATANALATSVAQTATQAAFNAGETATIRAIQTDTTLAGTATALAATSQAATATANAQATAAAETTTAIAIATDPAKAPTATSIAATATAAAPTRTPGPGPNDQFKVSLPLISS